MGRFKKVFTVLSLIFVLSFLVTILSGSGLAGRPKDDMVMEDLSKKIIRLHVIANSNSPDDQRLKLKVKDEIVKVLNEKLASAEDVEESKKYIIDNLDYLEEIALRKVRETHEDYNVKAVFGKFPFPVKTYGYVTLPSGEYEALRIIIGKGNGENWWCVLFPPLCFVDITKDDAHISLDKYLTSDEIEAIKNVPAKENSVEVRFKVVELWESAKGNLNKIKFALR